MSDGTHENGWISNRMRSLSFYRSIADRLERLEAEALESRQLSMRIAELTDLVTELIVPLAQQDPERARALLAKYHGELGT